MQARQLEPQGAALLLQTRLQIRARYARRPASPSRLLLLLQPCSRARAGRKITFADFAFFDSEQYKILFELVRSAVRNRLRSTWCVVFLMVCGDPQVDSPPEEELGFDWDSAGIEVCLPGLHSCPSHVC